MRVRSLVEQAMIFMLGFLVMGLLGLFFLPAYWRRAVRLSMRQLQTQIPLSMDEIAAGRDALRAESAAKIRLVEIKSERAGESQARDRVELGRRATVMNALDNELADAKREGARLAAELETAVRAQADAQAQRFAALKEIWDATGLMQRSRDAHGELMREHRDLQGHADSQRATIAALDTRVSGLEMRLEDRARALAEADARHAALASASADLQATLDATSAAGAASREAMARLQGRHDKARARIAQMEAGLSEAGAVQDALSGTLEREKTARSAAGEALEQAAARERAMQSALQRQAEVAQAANANFAKRIEGLREEIAALKAGDAAAAMPPAMAMLRQSIADLGAELLRIHRAPVQDNDEAGRPAPQGPRAQHARANLTV